MALSKNHKKTKLFDSLLVKKEFFNINPEKIEHCPDPISLIIANNYAKKDNFYRNLALIFNLQYLKELKIKADPKNSLALQVPAALFVENRVFIYQDQSISTKKAIIASHTPFIADEIIQEILSYTEFNQYELVITHPNQINNALAQTFYQEFSVSTTDIIHVFHEIQSTKFYQTLQITRMIPIVFFVICLAIFFLYPSEFLALIFVVLNVIYFIVNPFKIYVFARSINPIRSKYITDEEVKKVDYADLPKYTILIPLKDEAVMVPKLVKNILAIDYPKDKLDVKFIAEVTDKTTLQALEKEGVGLSSSHASHLDICTQIVKVPIDSISTKPRSCDYALGFARGEYCVIYDAEDKPQKDQLKKAFLGFSKSSLKTVCVQGRLNFYNSRQNILTRFFSLEYGFWFDHYLPGLQEVDSPIPLGGTSNHLITPYLKKLGTWDPYNVTEDADLGARIYRYQHETAVINSYTWEEANSDLMNWIRQRTRWQKGFLLTFLVHTAKPFKLYQELGLRRTILLLITYGSNYFMPLFNVALWFITLISLTPITQELTYFGHSSWVAAVAYFNLIGGNLTYIFVHLISTLKNKRYDLIPFALLIPVYWFLISLATVRAAYQFVVKPFYWEKTKHGLED